MTKFRKNDQKWAENKKKMGGCAKIKCAKFNSARNIRCANFNSLKVYSTNISLLILTITNNN